MPQALTKWTAGALVLIFASLLLYLFVVVAERTESTPVSHHDEKSHANAGREPHPKRGERAGTETVERAVTPAGIDTEGRQTWTEAAERGETVLGIDLEGPFIVTAAIVMWSLIALGLVGQATWAPAAAIGWAVLSALGDAFEVVHQASEVNWGFAAAALTVAVMHLAIVYMCFRAVRQPS